jgi:hypothetical protein
VPVCLPSVRASAILSGAERLSAVCCTQEICALFAAQLQGLGDTNSQSFAQYFYLLERLAMVNRCRLLCPRTRAVPPPAPPTAMLALCTVASSPSYRPARRRHV